MTSFGSEHLEHFIGHLRTARFAGPNGQVMSIDDWSDEVVEALRSIKRAGRGLYFVGNGASQGMACHFSTDLTKNGWMKSRSLTDPSLLTCMANDYCYEDAFAEALKRYLEPGDGLVAISSSGESENIVRAAQVAAQLPEPLIISLTGFSAGNRVDQLGTYSLHVPVSEYGMVESAHTYFFHLIIDLFLDREGA